MIRLVSLLPLLLSCATSERPPSGDASANDADWDASSETATEIGNGTSDAQNVTQTAADKDADSAAIRQSDAGSGTAGNSGSPLGEPVDGSTGMMSEPCPAPAIPQSTHADCPLYCPPERPEDGSACSDRLLACPYRALDSCECAADSLTWRCYVPRCGWDAASAAWVGDGCNACPVVERPLPGDMFGACDEASPTCDFARGAYFYCEDGQYQFELIVPP